MEQIPGPLPLPAVTEVGAVSVESQLDLPLTRVSRREVMSVTRLSPIQTLPSTAAILASRSSSILLSSITDFLASFGFATVAVIALREAGQPLRHS